MKSSYWIERYSPFVISVIYSYLFYRLELLLPESLAFMSALLAISGIMIGFSLTSITLIFTRESLTLKKFEKHGMSLRILDYGKASITSNFLLIASSLVVVFTGNPEFQWFGISFAFLCVFSLTSFWRFSSVIFGVLESDLRRESSPYS